MSKFLVGEDNRGQRVELREHAPGNIELKYYVKNSSGQYSMRRVGTLGAEVFADSSFDTQGEVSQPCLAKTHRSHNPEFAAQLIALFKTHAGENTLTAEAAGAVVQSVDAMISDLKLEQAEHTQPFHPAPRNDRGMDKAWKDAIKRHDIDKPPHSQMR